MSLLIDNTHSYKHFNKNEMSIRRDDVFKIVFGDNNNKLFLKNFLEAILDTEITGIEIKNEVSLGRDYPENKLIKVDILAEINKKELINIEIQNRNEYNIIKRGQAHASRLYYSSLKKGYDYNIAKKTIIIWITDFEEFKDGPYHEISKIIRSSNGEILSEDIIYHFIQLPKFYKQVKEIKTPEEQWLAYLSCQLNKEELEELFKMNEKIRDVDLMAEAILKDQELMNAIERKEMEMIDENLKLEFAYEKGEKKGEEKNSKKVAKKLKKLNVPVEKIIEATGLSKEEVEKL